MERFAKIVSTLGPASSDETTLRKMIEAGLDVARLNFSHGTQKQHEENIALIRRLSKECNKPITILADLQGPKLRIGKLENNEITLTEGQIIALSSSKNTSAIPEDVTFIPFDVPMLHEAVIPGNRILMDDGNLEIEVTQLDGVNIYAKVIVGGLLRSHKGVNLPGS
ncbi:MAG TPA: pyruvate kinase, partial [Anaerolineaceae bacterium]|nr:pyruvate kinase [Anaerolineaceae bacterium]